MEVNNDFNEQYIINFPFEYGGFPTSIRKQAFLAKSHFTIKKKASSLTLPFF